MTLEETAQQLRAQIPSANSRASLDRWTDFAIDALNADRGDLVVMVLIPLAARIPGNARVWQLLGLAHRQEQQSEAALKALTHAAGLAPNDARIANGYATASFEAGIASAALFDRARRLSPGDPELLLSHAAALVADGQPTKDAEAIIEPLVATHPEWARGHEALANWRWMSGNASDFARSFAPAVRLRPTDLALRFAWYRALSQVGKWDEARAVIEEGRAIAGDLPQFDAADAYIATETGEDDRAEILFSRAAQLNDPGTDVSHIRHCLRTGRIDKALCIADPLLRGPAAAMVWPYMSLIWRLRGDPRAAWLDGEPPYILTCDLAFPDDELHALAVALRKLHRTQHHPPEQSLRGGTQTDGPLFMRLEPEIQAVRTTVRDAVRSYVDGLPPVDPNHPMLFAPRGNLRFEGAWSVRLGAQGFHVCHTHSQGWISSALYIALPQNLGPAPAGWLQLGGPPPDLRLDLQPYCKIEPKPGRLVLFPSTMWHGTVPFDDGERLTIAFDVAVPSR
jgi:Flp pilus assembly protein TadD